MIPYLDRRKIAALKQVFYAVIVHSKYGLQGEETKFSLKYVPEYSTITEMGECEEAKATYSHVESRNLKTFVIGIGVIGIGTWVGLKVLSGIASRVLS